jgi:hypothetical protein
MAIPPKYVHIHELFQQIRRMLPEERLRKLEQRNSVNLQRSPLSIDRIPMDVLNRLQHALWRQEIEFQYRSNQPGDVRIWHRVAPYDGKLWAKRGGAT